MSGSANSLDFHVKVIGFKEAGSYTAVALEMDLSGFGDSIEEALEDLEDHIRMQISFALQQNDLSLLERQAPKEYQDMYRDCMAKFIKQESVSDRFVRCMPFPSPSSFQSGAFAMA